jgi:hypothetical protein
MSVNKNINLLIILIIFLSNFKIIYDLILIILIVQFLHDYEILNFFKHF